jgi:S-formylglutathione hydrolase FrmB
MRSTIPFSSIRLFNLRRLFLVITALLTCYNSPPAHGETRPEIVTVQFKSQIIGQTLPYQALLPSDYATSATRYPVLFMLHGLTGRYTDWFTRTNLADYAARYRLIIITPDGRDSWYTDSATVPTDKYETYFFSELLPDVDDRFRTIKDRRGRGVAGLSMGGYGALKFALKHPDQFGFAASMSGALDAATRTDEKPGFAWDFLRPSILAAYGAKNSPEREANDLRQLARNLPDSQIGALPFLYFDCGTEDGFLETNRDLAAIFLTKKIPHEYRQLPGGHDWGYWDKQSREILRLFAERLRRGGVLTD